MKCKTPGKALKNGKYVPLRTSQMKKRRKHLAQPLPDQPLPAQPLLDDDGPDGPLERVLDLTTTTREDISESIKECRICLHEVVKPAMENLRRCLGDLDYALKYYRPH